MDFLDPQKVRRHNIRLMIIYVAMSVLVLATTVVLIYMAYGWGLGKNGQIIQNGLVFFSSHPSGGQIYVDGSTKGTTNKRLTLPAGTYTVSITKDGYRSWQRTVPVDGGAVERFDYAFLFPSELTTDTVHNYASSPSFMIESPDQHWLLAGVPGQIGSFDQYDLTSKTVAQTLTAVSLPAGVLSSSPGAQKLDVVAWANDNQHVLFKHTYAGSKTEYILFNNATPASSVNLTKTLRLGANVTVSLQNNNYDQYYIYDKTAATLSIRTLSQSSSTVLLEHVLAFTTSGSGTVLYVTATGAPAGQAEVMLYQGGQSYPLLIVPAKGPYMLAVAQYSGDWYVAVGAASEGSVYLYKNPADQYNNSSAHVVTPLSTLRVPNPTYVSFSPNSRFVMVEHGTSFAVYDAENDKLYTYALTQSLDKPQAHADWMDANHLEYVSGGKLMVFDFDKNNLQVLMPASPSVVPAYDSGYRHVYALAPAANPKQTALTGTTLLVPADL